MPGVARGDVDLVVATYNNPDLLEACLRSLQRSEYRAYNLIVVDDGSTEPVVQTVERAHPGAIVLRTNSNGGLVRALNKGIARGSAPLVALLNDDTEVSPEWLGELVNAADRHPAAGSFASKMLLYDDPKRFHSTGDGFGAWGMPFNRGVWLEDVGQYDTEEHVFGACAGAALYRRSALERVRLFRGTYFNPSFFMYLEDVELAWRLQFGGYACVYVPTASVLHHLSATGGGSLASYYVSRNIWHLYADIVPKCVLRSNARRIVTHHAGRNIRHVRGIRQPAARAALRGSRDGLLYFARNWRRSADKECSKRPIPMTH